MKKAGTYILLIIGLALGIASSAQYPTVSLGTDMNVLRSLKQGQRFTALGQTINFNVHLAPKDGLYAWFSYYTTGKFSNNVRAVAKSPLTIPQEIPYRNNAAMRYRQLSLGWKRYLKGTPIDESWNLYGYAGFGILLGGVENSHSVGIDTSTYALPVHRGEGNFKRLTFDLGLGYEVHAGGAIYFYGEAKAWLPASDYPSRYLFVNDNAPVTATLGIGIRILFYD